MTGRLSTPPPLPETPPMPDQLRTLAAWLKANDIDGWAQVATDSAEEIERLHKQLRDLQRFNLHSD